MNTFLTVFLAAGMDAIPEALKKIQGVINSSVSSIVSIIDSLLFLASIVMLITAYLADKTGRSVGFNIGGWGVGVLVVSAAIFVAKSVFGIK